MSDSAVGASVCCVAFFLVPDVPLGLTSSGKTSKPRADPLSVRAAVVELHGRGAALKEISMTDID